MISVKVTTSVVPESSQTGYENFWRCTYVYFCYITPKYTLLLCGDLLRVGSRLLNAGILLAIIYRTDDDTAYYDKRTYSGSYSC